MKAALAALTFLVSPAVADERFGSFVIPDDQPGVIVLDGEIGLRTALEFRMAKLRHPELQTLVLNSIGGSAGVAADIARDIVFLKMATYVPKGKVCGSACVYVLLAGSPRVADGQVAVHRPMLADKSPEYAAWAETWLDELMLHVSAPAGLVTAMKKTVQPDVYWVTDKELRAFGLR